MEKKVKKIGDRHHTCLLCGYVIGKRKGMFVSKSWLKGIGVKFKNTNKRIKNALVHKICYHELKKNERALKNLESPFNIIIETRKK